MTSQRLKVEISDAVSEKLDVRYTIKTKTSLPAYDGSEFSVDRAHGEFTWLYTSLLDNSNHAGLLIPPKPMKPDMTDTR